MAIAAAATAYAHGGATGIVKERMDAMGAMGNAVKTIAPMMRGEAEYDANVVRSAAETFKAHAGIEMTRLFPEGSGGAPSEARGEVWTNWDEFAEIAKQLEIYAKGMAAAAENGLVPADSSAVKAEATMGGATELMGGTSDMMGGAMMQGAMTVDDISAMPADGAFAMVSQACSACHTKFRAESK